MATVISINLSLDQVKAIFPKFSPVIQSAADVLGAMAPTELSAWSTLAKSDPAAAKAALRAKLTASALAAATEAAGQALDSGLAADADRETQLETILTDAWHIIVMMAASAVTVAL
jgi:hypothetical protein